jgi:hypothetical protein
MTKATLFISSIFVLGSASAQMHVQSGATVFISAGAKVTLQGDLTGLADIQGPGTVSMKGSSLQNVNMNGFTIPNLEIDNAANVVLTGGNARIGTNLLFTSGQLLTGSQDLFLAPAATVSNYNTSRFIHTDGVGQVRKELTADVANLEIPIGQGTNYRPVYLTTSGSAYASANVGVRVVNGATPNRPPMIANFLLTRWPVTRTGITGGTVTLGGQYIDPTDVSGTEANLSGYFFNGTDWSSVAGTNNAATNLVAAPVTGTSGELYGMNRFIAVGARALLQGPYDAVSGLMNDNLRTPSNLIPINDPYRSAPYTTTFTHTANSIAEMTTAGVFTNQASVSDNIVDWVFLELRDNNTPSNVLQTRSALIQRDGDIVDVDGVSPVTFNQVNGGGYTIAVRHRNHIGMASLQSAPNTFSETKSTAFSTNLADFRNTAKAKMGTAVTNYAVAAHPSLSGNTAHLLYAGNANSNNSARISGPNASTSDFLAIQATLGALLTISETYSASDLNMNRIVRITGPNSSVSDFLFLQNVVLNGLLIINQPF